MSWIERLQERWQLKSAKHVLIILIVFACTGFTVMFLKRPVVALFTSDDEQGIWFTIIYYILILPVYFIILLFYGFIFGQYRFFWTFVKKTFTKKKNVNEN